MAQVNDIFQRELLRVLDQTVDNPRGIDPFSQELSRLLLESQIDPLAPKEEGPGFFARTADAITPRTREEVALIGAGILAPTLQAGQGIFQLPGLLTSRYLPTDRAADFLGRMSEGLLRSTEQAALDAGASPELVSDSHLFGEILGYTVPVIASLKAARLVTGIQGPITTLHRSFVLDTVAGGIFGAGLLPGEELQERALNAMRESALFGIGGLVMNGLIFAAAGFKFSRARAVAGDEELGETLLRISNGERVVIEKDGISLARLMNEEGFLASSPEAYEMLARFEIEEALIQSVRGMAEAGHTRGHVQSVGRNYPEVQAIVERLKGSGPPLVYDIIRSSTGAGYDIHFGLRGLSNQARAQIGREGRYAGQIIQKGTSLYEYVRRGTASPKAAAVRANLGGPRLPPALAGAKPRYGFGQNQFELVFDSDLDRALYIIAQAKPSRQDAAYLAWARRQMPGTSDAELRRAGAGVRDRIKSLATGEEDGGTLRIQAINTSTAPSPSVRPQDKGGTGSLVVKTIDGETTTIQEAGVTNQLYGMEDIPISATGQAMYADYERFFFERMNGAAAASGGLDETATLRALRDGHIDLNEQNLRTFESPGAITHPEELGLVYANLGNPAEAAAAARPLAAIHSDDGMVWVSRVDNEGHLAAAVEMVKKRFGMADDEALDAIANVVEGGTIDKSLMGLSKGSFDPRTGRYTAEQIWDEAGPQIAEVSINPADRFVRDFMQRGKAAGTLLEPTPIRRSEDAFEAWIKERGLSLGAADVEAFRAHFNAKIRQRIWSMVPEEDMAIFRRIRNETNALLDANPLSTKALAHTKGFHYDQLPNGRVAIRDINTGARLEFGNETFAREMIEQIIRSEKDPMSPFLTPGPMGMPTITGGFDPTDGTWSFGENISGSEILDKIPFSGITNKRDYLIPIEEFTGVPFFSRGFGELDVALNGIRHKLAPIGKRIAAAWKGLKRPERKAVLEFWSVPGNDLLQGTALVQAASRAGLSSKQIRAFTQARSLMDYGAQLDGLPRSRFMSAYGEKIRPLYEAGADVDLRKVLKDDPEALRELESFAGMFRSGNLSLVEMDPEIVMHKFFRSVFYKQDVAPIELNVRRLTDMKIGDLSAAQQQVVMTRAARGTTKESHVLPEPIRDVLTEYLNHVRGDLNPGLSAWRKFTNRFFKLLGMETDEHLFDELFSLGLTTQYGAALGARLSSLNRNVSANTWFMYTRLGGKHGTEALRNVMKQDGFDKWVGASAIRPVESSGPQADAIFNSWFQSADSVRGTGPFSMAAASTIRKFLRAGRVSRKVAEKFLVPYGSSDQISRAWAAEWQYLHTAEKFALFDKGKISWETFLDDGLPFFSSSIKKEFRYQFDKHGRETALQWIGKQAADESNFIYSSGSSPAWMQRPFGKMIGVFGQWPLWAQEMYFQRMRLGTPSQIGAFWARTAIITGAFANMTLQTGISMYSWIAPLFFQYGGGPAADLIVQTRLLAEGTLDQKAAALKGMGRALGDLALPGQVAYREWTNALDQTDPSQALLMMTLGRPVDKGNFTYDWITNPDRPEPEARQGSDPFLEGLGLGMQGRAPIDLSSSPSAGGGTQSVRLSASRERPLR